MSKVLAAKPDNLNLTPTWLREPTPTSFPLTFTEETMTGTHNKSINVRKKTTTKSGGEGIRRAPYHTLSEEQSRVRVTQLCWLM